MSAIYCFLLFELVFRMVTHLMRTAQANQDSAAGFDPVQMIAKRLKHYQKRAPNPIIMRMARKMCLRNFKVMLAI